MLIIKKIISVFVVLLILIYSSGFLLIKHTCVKCNKTQVHLLQKHDCKKKHLKQVRKSCCSKKMCDLSKNNQTEKETASTDNNCCKYEYIYLKIKDSFLYNNIQFSPEQIVVMLNLTLLLQNPETTINEPDKDLFKIPPLIKQSSDLLSEICIFRL